MPLEECLPSITLLRNTMAAVGYWKSNPQALLVLVGGRPFGEVSEAEMMAAVAVAHGVPRERLLLDLKGALSTEVRRRRHAACAPSRRVA